MFKARVEQSDTFKLQALHALDYFFSKEVGDVALLLQLHELKLEPIEPLKPCYVQQSQALDLNFSASSLKGLKKVNPSYFNSMN